MPQNGRTSFIQPDSEGAPSQPSNGSGMYFDAMRRRDRLIRRESALSHRRHDLTVREADGYSAKMVEQAADDMCDMLKAGRLVRKQVEREQRDDADRLTGWNAVGAQDRGTDGAQKVAAITYRMAVRNRALEKFDAYEFTDMTSTLRNDQVTAPQKPWKPWRPGAAPGGKTY